MVRNNSVDRRAFLKKSTAAAGVTGGIVSSVGSVTASHNDTYVEVSSAGGTGDYVLYTNDPDVHGGGDLESGDDIRKGSDSAELSGTIDSTSDVDTFVYDGELTEIHLQGNIRTDVYNPNINVWGTLDVWGANGVEYAFCARDSIDGSSNIESCENINTSCAYGCIDSLNDEDYYDISGVIEYAENYDSSDWLHMSYTF